MLGPTKTIPHGLRGNPLTAITRLFVYELSNAGDRSKAAGWFCQRLQKADSWATSWQYVQLALSIGRTPPGLLKRPHPQDLEVQPPKSRPDPKNLKPKLHYATILALSSVHLHAPSNLCVAVAISATSRECHIVTFRRHGSENNEHCDETTSSETPLNPGR